MTATTTAPSVFGDMRHAPPGYYIVLRVNHPEPHEPATEHSILGPFASKRAAQQHHDLRALDATCTLRDGQTIEHRIAKWEPQTKLASSRFDEPWPAA